MSEPRIWLDDGRLGGGRRLYVQWRDTGPLWEIDEYGATRMRFRPPAGLRDLTPTLSIEDAIAAFEESA